MSINLTAEQKAIAWGLRAKLSTMIKSMFSGLVSNIDAALALKAQNTLIATWVPDGNSNFVNFPNLAGKGYRRFKLRINGVKISGTVTAGISINFLLGNVLNVKSAGNSLYYTPAGNASASGLVNGILTPYRANTIYMLEADICFISTDFATNHNSNSPAIVRGTFQTLDLTTYTSSIMGNFGLVNNIATDGLQVKLNSSGTIVFDNDIGSIDIIGII